MIDQQEKLLEDAKKVAKEQAYFMRKALENADLRNGLKHASLMLYQLKTALLAPRNYYILWMAIFDYIRQLQNYFKDDFRRGRKMVDVYQAVQHAPNIIPRIYLMITVGSVYIQSHEQGSDKILYDLIQVMKAVQNPLRGLFLRYYFLKLCKDRLPDTGSEYEIQGKNIEHAIEIIHINLRESTNLLIRIGSGRDKNKRLKQKNDLKVLVGENLMRISSLEGVNIKIYKDFVLPKMLQLIKGTKDSMSQQYLLDCMIQGFAQQFHINTLPQLLQVCSQNCQKEVDMKIIFITLMDRLSTYLTDSGNIIQNIENGNNIYNLFKINIQQLVKKSEINQVNSTLKLYSAFLQFTIKCYPLKNQYVNNIILDSTNYCSQNEDSIDDECQIYISKLLIHPLQTQANIILTMNQYPNLMKYLKFKRRRQVAKQLIKAICKRNIDLTDEIIIKQLLIFIQPILKKQKDYQEISLILFKQQQIQVAKIMSFIQNQDPTIIWNILKLFIDKFLQGGEERIKITLPSAIFRLLKLALQIYLTNQGIEPKKYKKILDLSKLLIVKLSQVDAVLGIKIYLQLLSLINKIDTQKYYDQFTYQMASQCLLLYQSEVTDARLKLHLLQLIINTFLSIKCISEQNYETLISNIVSFCSKVLKKNEQVHLLLSCCFLFTNELANEQKIHEVLKKCAKLANTSINQSLNNIGLLLDILDSYLYFTTQKNIIQDKDQAIPQIIQLIQEKFNQDVQEEETKIIIQQCKQRWNVLNQKIKS